MNTCWDVMFPYTSPPPSTSLEDVTKGAQGLQWVAGSAGLPEITAVKLGVCVVSMLPAARWG